MNPNFDASLKRCTQQQLLAMLLAIESRLGTATELPGDLDRVCAIAHQLNNVATGVRLLAELGPPAPGQSGGPCL